MRRTVGAAVAIGGRRGALLEPAASLAGDEVHRGTSDLVVADRLLLGSGYCESL